MHKQVQLIRNILNQVMYASYGKADSFAAYYEVFYVAQCVIDKVEIDDKIPRHVSPVLIQKLIHSNITAEDLGAVNAVRSHNVNLLQAKMTDLMLKENLTVYAAAEEIINIVGVKTAKYNDNYLSEFILADITAIDTDYTFKKYRLDAIDAMINLANVSLPDAINKLAVSTEQAVKMIPLEIVSTKEELEKLAEECMGEDLKVEAFVKDVLAFINKDKKGPFNPVQQAILKSLDALFLKNLFDDAFHQHLVFVVKRYRINRLIHVDVQKYMQVIGKKDSQAALATLAAEQAFWNCYENNDCGKLIQQPNIATALRMQPSKNYSTPSENTLHAALPHYLQQHPEIKIQTPVPPHRIHSSSYLLRAHGFAVENPGASTAVLALFFIYVFRDYVKLLNPLNCFRFFCQPTQQNKIEKKKLRREKIPLLS